MMRSSSAVLRPARCVKPGCPARPDGPPAVVLMLLQEEEEEEVVAVGIPRTKGNSV